MKNKTLFISDLHLDRERPEIIQLFSEFLNTEARESDALYILGDLFEYWIGDDQPVNGLEDCFQSLKTLTINNIPVYFIHGNRDFLLGEAFSERTGMTLLPETTVIDLYGTPTLIMHGDTLCTDDVDYQNLRSIFRNPEWQKKFLAQSLEERIQEALQLRERSLGAKQEKAESIMDVNQAAVEETMRQHDVRQLIHGHTHRPAIHDLIIDGKPGKRIVLGDWYEQGSVLRCDAKQLRLDNL